jgi:hypothetical protein
MHVMEQLRDSTPLVSPSPKSDREDVSLEDYGGVATRKAVQDWTTLLEDVKDPQDYHEADTGQNSCDEDACSYFQDDHGRFSPAFQRLDLHLAQ